MKCCCFTSILQRNLCHSILHSCFNLFLVGIIANFSDHKIMLKREYREAFLQVLTGVYIYSCIKTDCVYLSSLSSLRVSCQLKQRHKELAQNWSGSLGIGCPPRWHPLPTGLGNVETSGLMAQKKGLRRKNGLLHERKLTEKSAALHGRIGENGVFM